MSMLYEIGIGWLPCNLRVADMLTRWRYIDITQLAGNKSWVRRSCFRAAIDFARDSEIE